MNASSPGTFRWRIVALLFVATTINYIDRQVLSFAMTDEAFRKEMLGLAPTAVLNQEHIDQFRVEYSKVDSVFKFAYAIGFLLMGWLIDRIGTRRGFSLGILLWSIAAVGTSFVGTLQGLKASRLLLGLGEAANFPAAIKSVSEWFPRRERAYASGLFNAGTNVGIIITALLVPYLILNYGWRSSFWVTGLLGFALLVVWWFTYSKPERNGRVSPTELAYIRADAATEPSLRVSWLRLLSYKQTWAYAIGKFLTDPIWWFYLAWLPDFFNNNEALDQQLDLKSFGLPFLIIYIVSDAGSIFFGWLSTQFMAQGWTANRARKFTMLLCALCVAPIIYAAKTNSLTVAIGLIALAAAAHQGWSANMYTFASDLFPKSVTATVTSIGGMFGAIGGILLARYSGDIINATGYFPPFIIAASTYPLALLLIHWVLPRLEPVTAEELTAEWRVVKGES
jgi:MFS transporter, ACS family, hexuronate transporter